MGAVKNFRIILFIICSLSVQGILAEVICENLPPDLCAFAIASSAKRCVLEKSMNEDGIFDYMCTTSEAVVERLSLSGYIENDGCVDACGVDRGFIGISSDAFLSAEFTPRFCSPACYNNCPNIVDLYFNLAAGEGVFLPGLCKKQKENPHRAMLALLSSSGSSAVDVPDPVVADVGTLAPTGEPLGDGRPREKVQKTGWTRRDGKAEETESLTKNSL